MHQIVVDDGMAKLISQAADRIEIRDPRGRLLGYVAQVVHGFTGEDVAIARERLASNEPRYTTRAVLDYLQSLQRK
jgi:hypothetical protein